MAKQLKDILKQAHDTIKGAHKSTTEPLSTGKDPGVDYKPKAGDEADFIAKHSIEKWDEPYGNPNYADKVPYTLSKEKHHGNTISKAKAANEETINELSPVTKKAYVAAATDDKKHAERQANHSEYTAKHAKTEKQRSNFSNEAKWLKSIADKRAKGIAMATKEETEVSESKKAEDTKCNNTPGQTWCPIHEMTDCSSARQIKELSTDLLHRAAHKAAKVAMTDVQGRSGPIFKKRAAQANKFRAKGMEQEKREKAAKSVKEETLDEISNKLALSYAKGASKSMDAAAKGSAGHETFMKRNAGHTLALDKTNPEHKRMKAKVGTTDANAKDAAYKKSIGEAIAPGQFSEPSDAAKAKVKQIQQKDADKAAVGRAKMGITSEGAKVDRMEKHIEASEKASGKSGKDAKSIAWATLNKRGMLDNKNKKAMKEDLAVPLLGGDHPPRGESEEAIEMVKAELKALANKAMHLVMQMPAGMHVEPWCQSKIAQAKSYISDVHDYMIYGDHNKPEEDEGTMDTPITFPNMSVDVNTGQNV